MDDFTSVNYFYSSVQSCRRSLSTVKLSSCTFRIFHGSCVYCFLASAVAVLPKTFCSTQIVSHFQRHGRARRERSKCRLSNERITTSISPCPMVYSTQPCLDRSSSRSLVPPVLGFPAPPFVWVPSANPCQSIHGCDWLPYRLVQWTDRSRHPCHNSVMRKEGKRCTDG